MKITKTVLLTLGVAAALTACSKVGNNDDNPTGNWTSAAPVSVTQNVADATSATKSVSFDFNAPANGEAGVVTYSADYDVTATIPTDSVPQTVTYKVTASVKGTWVQDTDDHDDYLLTFDKNTLSVSGTDAPELGPVTDEFLNSLAQFTTIEDVEVSKDGTHMTFETNNPEVKYHFVKK